MYSVTFIRVALITSFLFSLTAWAHDGDSNSIDRFLQEQQFESGYSPACMAALNPTAPKRSRKSQIFSLHAAAAHFRVLMDVEPNGPNQARRLDREALKNLLVHLDKLSAVPTERLRAFSFELYAIAYQLTDLAIFADQMDPIDLAGVLKFSRAVVKIKPVIRHEIEANIVLATYGNLMHQLAWSMRYAPPLEALRESARLVLPLKEALDFNAWPIYYTLAQSLVLTQAVVNAHRVPNQDLTSYIKVVEKTYAMFEMIAAHYLLERGDQTMVQTGSYLSDLRQLRRQPDLGKFPGMRAAIDRLLALFDLETTRAN